jgi:hypothetical protein
VEQSKADVIRQLSKKWLETGDDGLLDELKRTAHNGIGFEVCNGRILERYMEASLKLHVHFIGIGDAGCVNNNLCAVAQYRVGDGSEQDVSCGDVRECNAGIYCVDGCQCKRPMFIDVHELVYNQQGMNVGERIATLIRLQLLDECRSLYGNAAKPVSLKLSQESVRRKTDGELVASGRDFVVNENQLPDNVIERGSKIMKKVANNHTEVKVGIRENETETIDKVIVRIALANNMAFVQMGHAVEPEGFEVLFSPDDFLPNAV